MEEEEIRRTLVGLSYPQVVDIGIGRLRRYWVLRTGTPLPNTSELVVIQRRLQNGICERLRSLYSGTVNTSDLESALPVIVLSTLDEHHLVVRIDFAAPSRSVGDSAGISQWGVLQDLQTYLQIDDIQGIPKRFWFFMKTECGSR